MVRVSDAKSDYSRRGEAGVRILNLKTTWSEFQVPSQTTLAECFPFKFFELRFVGLQLGTNLLLFVL